MADESDARLPWKLELNKRLALWLQACFSTTWICKRPVGIVDALAKLSIGLGGVPPGDNGVPQSPRRTALHGESLESQKKRSNNMGEKRPWMSRPAQVCHAYVIGYETLGCGWCWLSFAVARGAMILRTFYGHTPALLAIPCIATITGIIPRNGVIKVKILCLKWLLLFL